MAEVYSKSPLTVAASGSANGKGGCRVLPETRSYGPVDIECSGTDAEGNFLSYLYRIWARDLNPITSVLQHNPLNKRGWTVQERELAPRLVHYSHDTIRWECCELSAKLEFPCGDHLAFDAGRLFDWGSESRAPQIGLPRNDSKQLDSSTKHNFVVWTRSTVYGTFSHETDRYFACHARHGAHDRRTYFRSLPCWSVGVIPRTLSALDTLKTPSSQQLSTQPTVSFACANLVMGITCAVRGPLEYSSLINGYWHSFNVSPDPRYTPQLIEAHLVPAGPDPYSTLSSGSINH